MQFRLNAHARSILLIAFVGGALSVALGAFGAHALKASLDAKQTAWYELAVRYQMWHSLALLGLGCLQALFASAGRKLLWWAAILMVAGVLLFSGSLYTLALQGPRWVVFLTPLGGSSLLLGWVLAIVAVVRVARA